MKVPLSHLLVAVSGGADSTALLHALAEWAKGASCIVTAAHYVHRTRDDQSHRVDLDFLRDLCRRLGVPLIVGEARAGEIEAKAREEGSAVEAAARKLRYRYLKEAAIACGARIVCTAHTEDDQVETVAMSVSRGVESPFLSGIPVQRDLGNGVSVLRPLLRVSRDAVVRYLRAHDLRWIDDPTNSDPAFDRNRMRHDRLPRLRSTVPDARRRLLDIQARASSLRAQAEAQAQTLVWRAAAGHAGDASEVDCDAFLAAGRAARLVSLFREAARRGMVRPSSRISVRYFEPLLREELKPGTIVHGRGHRIERRGDRLIWSRDVVRSPEYGYLRRVKLGVAVRLPTGPAFVIRCREKASTDDRPSVIELNEVHEPLVVRPCRAGDRINRASGSKSVRRLVSSGAASGVPPHTTAVLLDPRGVLAVLSPEPGRVWTAHREQSDGIACALEITGVKADA